MQRTITPLLTALALVVVAAGGAAAAGDTASVGPSSNETDGADVGICLVGVDSPCNDAPSEDDSSGDRIAGNGSGEERHVWIPEDQNRDGEIDDRFRGDERRADAGICVVGADSPCNDASRAESGAGEQIEANSTSEESHVWIPEDQNHDGEIDDRFVGDRSAVVGALFDVTAGLFGWH